MKVFGIFKSSRLARTLLFAMLAGLVDGCSENNSIEHANVAFDIAPDGKTIVFASAKGDLFRFNLTSQKVMCLTETAITESTPTFSPDGSTITYAASTADKQSGSIYTLQLDRKQQNQLTMDSGVYDLSPKFSHDGSQIAFARAHRYRPYSMGGWTWDDWDVYTMKSDGTNLKRISKNKYYGITRVVFAPNDKELYFSAMEHRPSAVEAYNIYLVPTDGSAPPKPAIPQPTAAVQMGAWGDQPDFSPDGKTMVAISDRSTAFQYSPILIDITSGKLSTLNVKASAYNTNPKFAPSGDSILFLAGIEHNSSSRPIFSLWTVGIDGTHVKQLADSQLFTNPTQ